MKWNLIKNGLPNAGVPVIAAVRPYSFSSDKDEIKLIYPVLYQKNFWKDSWNFYDCTHGEVINEEYSQVVAWVEFPSIRELEERLIENEL